jgi:hypothetical protein
MRASMRRARLLFALAAACGHGLSSDDFPGAFAQAVCSVQSRCRVEGRYLEQDCEKELRTFFAPDLRKAIAARRVAFDAGQAQACLDGLLARGCVTDSTGRKSAPAPPLVDQACASAAKGLVAEGGQCFWLYECAAGSCVPAQPGVCPARCIGAVGEGGACPGKNNAGCDARAGLRCIAGVCSKRHTATQSCVSDSDCAADLFCRDGLACALRGNELASCGAQNECNAGLFCDLTASGGLCRRKGGQGKPCGTDAQSLAVDQECADGLVCKGYTPAKTGPTPGTCTPAGDEGATCFTAASITGCAGGLVCGGGRCALKPISGPCSVRDDCRPHAAFCSAAGQCQALKAAGEACVEAYECESSYCPAASGKCEEMAGACHEP